MGLKSLSKALWMGFAITFPLFSIKYFRYDNDGLGIHIAWPMLILCVIIVIELLISMVGTGAFPDFFHKTGSLLTALLVLFLLWHIVSLVFFDGSTTGLKDIIKMALGFFCMYGVAVFFPDDKSFYEKFWIIVIWGSALVISVFIYRYAFVFKSSFLSNIWEYKTREGRNHLTWYLTFIVPMAISYLLGARRKIISLLPLLILVVALVYSGGRGALLSIVAGLIFIVFVKICREGGEGLSKILPLLIGLSVIGLISITVINQFVEKPEFETRFDANSTDLKDDPRLALMEVGWKAFVSSPIYGIGVGNSDGLLVEDPGQETHNDYLAILVSLGLIGIFLFFGILGSILIKTWPIGFKNSGEIDWPYLGVYGTFFAIAVSLFLINAYTSTIFWIFIGLLLVGIDIDGNTEKNITGDNKVSLPRPNSRDLEKIT